MPEALQLPCRQCGRLVAVPVQSGMSLPLCESCGGTAPRVEASTVGPRAAPARPPAEPVARRVAATLAVLAVPVVGGLGAVAVTALAWWFWTHQPPPSEVTASARPTTTAPGAEVIALLQGQAGAVNEPARLLVARAWASRIRDSPEAIVEATHLAESAVARAPDDIEAIGLLVALYSQSGIEPERARALLERAMALSPTSPYVLAADAEWLLAAGDATAARARIASCLAAAPEDLVCPEMGDRVGQGTPAERLAGIQALSARWPQHVGLGRRAALLAAATGGPDAERTVVAALERFPGDVVLSQVRARMRFAAGDVATAGALARRLGKNAPPDVVAGLAGRSIDAADAGAAMGWVDLVGDTGTDAERAELRLRRAQALVLEAQANPGDARRSAAALEATAVALELSRGDPAAIQARLLAALVVGDFAAGQRAFERLETSGAAPGDLAGVYLARVALDLAQGVPAQSQRWMDEAVRLDPGSRDVWLWSATLAVAGQNPGAALGALRRAVPAVSAETRAGLRTLPMHADVATLTNGLVNLVGADSARARDLTLGLSVLDWLGGQPDRAIARLAAAVEGSEDATVWALYARLLWGQHDQYGAADAIGRARQLDGRSPAWVELARKIDSGGGR